MVLAVWLWRGSLRRLITEEATLSNDAPDHELVGEVIEQAADPASALVAAWRSGKIVHREVAIHSLTHIVALDKPLPPELNAILLAAALDPDMNVRESALAVMQERKHPALASLAAEQLKDCDLQVRLLGLNYLKSVGPQVGVPTVVPFLDDADPLVVTTSLKLLEKWSGQNFGVKLIETAPVENEQTGLKEYHEGASEKARAGAERARAWWSEHRGEFPPVRLEVPTDAYATRQAVPAPDFRLRTLDGQTVRLTDFRGKVVLINFWTTWCPACVSEMPELLALQKKHSGDLVILGVSLDYVPDEHGHIGGHPAVEEQGHSHEDHDEREATAAALKRVREKVVRTVKARGINYPILLDERNEAGGRYNGGELPTTVIVDAQGFVRRRFVGARTLPVFEAMLAEASSSRPK